MADSSGATHIAELGFDLSPILGQFQELEKWVQKEGIKLSELAESNWKLKVTVDGKGQAQFTAETQKANDALGKQAEALDKVNEKGNSLGNKAGKWFSAYQVWHIAERGMTELLVTMRDVETRMVEIGRVMNLTAQESGRLRDSLFGVSQDMAQSFDSSSEISLRFAQAGYHEAAENIEMTRTALLAMNTAELNAVNSTNSLVGIIKQWGLEGSDLITVIDKLNYTADNNAITTQDLVDGMLRASGAAKNAKISFDETVGALVALREATGRSGREIGTALNSLIAYTTRDSSINVFERLGATVWLDDAKTQMASVMDIWGQLSDIYATKGEAMVTTLAQQTDMTELFSEEVAAATDTLDQYNQMMEAQAAAENALNDAERTDLTATFGVYRRNYVIALLENFDKISQVVNDMDNAMGHSERENARYMETLEAKTNQLVSALQELAVQAGESGLMDLAKFAVDSATNISKLIRVSGGLIPLLVTITGLIGVIKREKITGIAAEGIAKLSTALTTLKTDIALNGLSAKTLGSAFVSSLGPAGAVSLAVTGIGLVTQAITACRQATEEARRETIEAGQESERQLKNLNDLSERMEALAQTPNRTIEQEEEYLDLQRQIAEALGHRTEELERLEAGSDAYLEKLRELTEEERAYHRERVENKKLALADEVEDIAGEQNLFKISVGAPGRQSEILKEFLDDYVQTAKMAGYDIENLLMPENPDEFLDFYYRLRDAWVQMGKEGLREGLYEKINGVLLAMEEVVPQLEEAGYSAEQAAGATDETGQSVGDATDTIAEAAPTLEEMRKALFGAADAAGDLANNLNTLESAMQTMADGESLSLDQVLELINLYPELADAVSWTTDGFYVQADAMEYARQASYLKMAADYAAVIASEALKNENWQLNESAWALSQQLATCTSITQAQALANQFLSSSGYQAASGLAAISQAGASMRAVLAGASMPIVPKRITGGGGGSGQNPRIKELQTLQKETEKSYKAQEKAVKDRYDAEIDALKRLKEEYNRQDEREDYEREREDLLAERADMEKRTSRDAVERIKEIDEELADLDREENRRQRDNALDDQIAAIEARRDAEITAIQTAAEAAKESYQAQIDALQAVAGASSRAASASAGALDGISDHISQLGDNWQLFYEAVVAMSDEAARIQILNNAEVAKSVYELWDLMQMAGRPVAMDQAFLGYQAKQNNPYNGYGVVTSGNRAMLDKLRGAGYATGGYVLEEGLAKLHPGEIIVRKDISEGLLHITEFMNRNALQTGGYGRQVILQGPLQNIENQYLADTADVRRVANDAGDLLYKEVIQLPD